MRHTFAFLLTVIGVIIIIWGDKPVKIKEGKVIKFIDTLNNYGGHLKWLIVAQRIMLKIVLGGIFIFFAVMIFLRKL